MSLMKRLQQEHRRKAGGIVGRFCHRSSGHTNHHRIINHAEKTTSTTRGETEVFCVQFLRVSSSLAKRGCLDEEKVEVGVRGVQVDLFQIRKRSSAASSSQRFKSLCQQKERQQH